LTDVVVEITAPGYRRWPVPEQRTATGGTIMLKPGELLKLHVALKAEERVPANERK
jgi:hypothetical protein